MCKPDTECVKVAPESVLINRRESQRYTLDHVFARDGGGVISRTPRWSYAVFAAISTLLTTPLLQHHDVPCRTLTLNRKWRARITWPISRHRYFQGENRGEGFPRHCLFCLPASLFTSCCSFGIYSGRVAKRRDLRSKGYGLDSHPLRCRVRPWTSHSRTPTVPLSPTSTTSISLRTGGGAVMLRN